MVDTRSYPLFFRALFAFSPPFAQSFRYSYPVVVRFACSSTGLIFGRRKKTHAICARAFALYDSNKGMSCNGNGAGAPQMLCQASQNNAGEMSFGKLFRRSMAKQMQADVPFIIVRHFLPATLSILKGGGIRLARLTCSGARRMASPIKIWTVANQAGTAVFHL